MEMDTFILQYLSQWSVLHFENKRFLFLKTHLLFDDTLLFDLKISKQHFHL